MPQSPFERLLGADFERLPAPVRQLHSLRRPTSTAGRAAIDAANGVFARLLAWNAGLPKPGRDVRVTVLFTPKPDGREHWDRRFGDRRYTSTIAVGAGRDEGFLIEHFGLFHLAFKLTRRADTLVWTLTRWRLFGIPLPRWSVPTSECIEGADGERLTFDIDVTFPLIGWVIRYRGWLVPQVATASPQPAA